MNLSQAKKLSLLRNFSAVDQEYEKDLERFDDHRREESINEDYDLKSTIEDDPLDDSYYRLNRSQDTEEFTDPYYSAVKRSPAKGFTLYSFYTVTLAA